MTLRRSRRRFGIGAIAECANLHGEEASIDIHVSEDFETHWHDAGADGFDFARGG